MVSVDFYKALEQDIEKILQNLVNQLKVELTRQGHVTSGKLRDSIELEITHLNGVLSGDFSVELIAEDYWNIVNDGLSSASVAKMFNGIGSGADRSKYITGLRNFFRKKGFTRGIRNKRLAFATARAHRRGGMPTRASGRFSSVNRRRGFVNVVLGKNYQVIDRRVNLAIDKRVNEFFLTQDGKTK